MKRLNLLNLGNLIQLNTLINTKPNLNIWQRK